LYKLSSFAKFFPIKLVAVPWSGETLKYLSPRVTFIASNLKRV